ncbi:MAG: threonine/serine dehydratase, partial [Alphaproteobacteria bacterium]
MSATTLPVYADIRGAMARIAGRAVRTPLLESPALNARCGGRILLKPEILQRTGSFKFRGACNFIAQLDEETRARGVIAYSSGNHAQGVAAAAKLFGAPATIVMPEDAPAIKIENTRSYGADVVTYDRWHDNREEIAAGLANKSGATLVPPYDHAWTIAGQGTVGIEIAEQCAQYGITADAVLVCCGGGGLTAGISLAMAEMSRATAVHPVEPAGFEDTARSLATGERVTNDHAARSICDALLAPTPGELTFALNARHAAAGLVVDDEAVRDAMRYAWRVLKLVVEPGGAVAL